MTDIENKYKVRLIPMSALTYGGDPAAIRAQTVSFDVTPTFSESRTVEYTSLSPIHTPGPIQVYRSTGARTFEVGAKLISRSSYDAYLNMKRLQILRSWQLPYFGLTDTLTAENRAKRNFTGPQDDSNYILYGDDREEMDRIRVAEYGVQLKGAPPEVLYLYAYSSSANDKRSSSGSFSPVNINRVPVVITSLSITYPDDVDYIPAYDPSAQLGANDQTEPFPVKMDVSISLIETHSPSEYEKFNLVAFKQGNLVSF